MSEILRKCNECPNEDLFKRAVLRAIPAIRYGAPEGQKVGERISVFFPLGVEEYGVDAPIACARAILNNTCEKNQYIETVSPPQGLNFAILPRNEELTGGN